jgi:hypothetical protein
MQLFKMCAFAFDSATRQGKAAVSRPLQCRHHFRYGHYGVPDLLVFESAGDRHAIVPDAGRPSGLLQNHDQ